MSTGRSPALTSLKRRIRAAAREARAALDDRAVRATVVASHLLGHPAFGAARSIQCYVAVRNEVETRPALLAALERNKILAVPYCDGDRLKLVRLESLAELEVGAYDIAEPRSDIRGEPGRQTNPSEIDVYVVPGVAFDRCGNRLGHGAGYYDRLLALASPSATLIGLAFDCQMVDSIPVEPHDVRMHYLITESGVYKVS